MRNTLLRVKDSVEQGNRIEQEMLDSQIFPELVIDMIAIGDEAGALDVVMSKVADAYEEEVDSIMKGLTSVVEPLLIVFLGGAVAFIAVALLSPYLNMVKAVLK